jgi:hypothetical protein
MTIHTFATLTPIHVRRTALQPRRLDMATVPVSGPSAQDVADLFNVDINPATDPGGFVVALVAALNGYIGQLQGRAAPAPAPAAEALSVLMERAAARAAAEQHAERQRAEGEREVARMRAAAGIPTGSIAKLTQQERRLLEAREKGALTEARAASYLATKARVAAEQKAGAR